MRQLYKRLKSVIVHYKADISLRELLTILILKLQLMKGLVDGNYSNNVLPVYISNRSKSNTDVSGFRQH